VPAPPGTGILIVKVITVSAGFLLHPSPSAAKVSMVKSSDTLPLFLPLSLSLNMVTYS
jgi:hypothetical protein